MIDRDYIISMIADMADNDGLSPRDFVEGLYAQRSFESYDEIDEAARLEIDEARQQRTQSRYDEFEKEAIENDIRGFKQLFPEIDPETIPQSVWDSAIKGSGLAAAYAIYNLKKDRLSEYAEQVNSGNGAKSAVVSTQGDEEAAFTEKQVSVMKPTEIKKNYKSIIKSMKNW